MSFFKDHWLGIFISSVLAGLIATFIYNHFSLEALAVFLRPGAGENSTAQPSSQSPPTPSGGGSPTMVMSSIESPYGVDPNTRALWHFDEISGTVAFDATGANNATALGSGEIVRGVFGNARYLRGQARGDYLMVPDSPTLRDLGAITIEAWVKPAAFRGYSESFVQKGTATAPYNLYLLGLQANEGVQDGTFHFEMAYVNDEQSKQPCNPISRLYQPDHWYYIAGTYDGQRCRLYVNGLLEAEDPPADSPPTGGRIVTSRHPLYMDNNEYLGTSKSNGLIMGVIDEVRISDIARTQEEIRSAARAMNNGAPNTVGRADG